MKGNCVYIYVWERKIWGGSCKTVLCLWGFLWRLIFYPNICFLTFKVNSLPMVTTKMPLRLLAKLVLLWLQIAYLTQSHFSLALCISWKHAPNTQCFPHLASFQTNSPTMVSSFTFLDVQSHQWLYMNSNMKRIGSYFLVLSESFLVFLERGYCWKHITVKWYFCSE